jgi:hypothetical protein
MTGSLDGPGLGAYSTLPTATAAVDKGLNSVAPNTDFFGTARPHNNGNPVDIGAVEVARPPTAATVSPGTLAFGTWATGTTSGTQNLTVTNTGTNAVAGMTITGLGTPFSRVTTGVFPGGAPNCAATLAAGDSCTIKVQFAPTAAQTYSTPITIAYTGVVVTPTPVTLMGTGVAGRATVAISPNPLAITLPHCTLANVLACSTATGVVTLTNSAPTGGAQMLITNVAVSGSGGTYSWSLAPLIGADTCTGATLAPGASCAVTVRFTASPLMGRSATTVRSGTIQFTDNGAASPQTGSLSGRALP